MGLIKILTQIGSDRSWNRAMHCHEIVGTSWLEKPGRVSGHGGIRVGGMSREGTLMAGWSLH